jgi:hypothetical protein
MHGLQKYRFAFFLIHCSLDKRINTALENTRLKVPERRTSYDEFYRDCQRNPQNFYIYPHLTDQLHL